MSTMMMPNHETIKKITGNVAVEVSDALYRNAASLLIQAVLQRTKKQLGDQNAIYHFLDHHEDVGEAIIGFALSIILEIVPSTTQMETRQMMACNLRVKSYEELGELLLNNTGISGFFLGGMDLELERALRLAGVQQQATVQTAPKTKSAAGAGDGSETAAAAAPAGY